MNLDRAATAPAGDSVLLRSFSALRLSAVADRDNAESFLTPVEFRAMLSSALRYLSAERDLRGFDLVLAAVKF